MADLRSGLGITQASLYAAFGSKEQLFRETVDLYRRTTRFGTTSTLASGTTAREAIHGMLQAAVDAFSAPGAPGGCLLHPGGHQLRSGEQNCAGSLATHTPPDIAIHRGKPEEGAAWTATSRRQRRLPP